MGEVLLKLAERVEALERPDREVDAAITLAIFPWIGINEDGDFIRKDGSPYDGVRIRVLEYTASLDAALTLVPDDPWIEIKGPRKYLNIPTHSPNYWSAMVSEWYHEGEGVGWGTTPALALCAAALKARATLAQKGGA